MQDVHRGVAVSCVVSPAFWAIPLTDRQVLDERVLVPAAGTGLAARIEGRHLDDHTSVFCHLVFQLAEELRPRDIRYRFGQMMVAEHPLHVQILHAHDLVFVREMAGLLVEEVAPDVCDLLVPDGKTDPLLPAVVGALLFAGEPALFADELLLMPAVGLRIRNGIAVAVGVELFDPGIQSDHAAGVGERNFFLFHAQRDVILPAC